MAVPSGQQLAKVTASIDMLEQQLRSLADMAGSLEPSDAKESTREVMHGLSALEHDLEAAREGSGGADPEQCQKLQKRIADATTKASRLRATASNKHAQTMEPVRIEVAQAVLARLSKRKDEDVDVFAVADQDKDGFVSRSEFQNFVNDCPGNFSRDQLNKLFDYLDDSRMGSLERDDFMRCMIVFYRVSRPSVDLVQTMGVAQGKLVRKLDVNEILELLEGPIKEINKVVRVKCRAMKDGAVGWATATGSNGVVFVEQKRVHFQVKSPTTLTDVLSAKACTTLRQLKEGELLEVLVWERTDPTTGARHATSYACQCITDDIDYTKCSSGCVRQVTQVATWSRPSERLCRRRFTTRRFCVDCNHQCLWQTPQVEGGRIIVGGSRFLEPKTNRGDHCRCCCSHLLRLPGRGTSSWSRILLGNCSAIAAHTLPLATQRRRCQCRANRREGISASSRMGFWRTALDLVQSLLVKRMRPSEVSSNAAAHANTGTGNWIQVVTLMSSLSESLPQPNVVSLVTLLTSMARAASWRRALAAAETLATRGLPANEEAHNTLLLAVSRGSNWELAFSHWTAFCTDVVGTSATMSGFATSGFWEAALKLLCAANEKRLEVDDFVLSSANCALSSTARWEWALRLLLAGSSAGFRDMKLDLEATACGASAMALQRSSSWEEAIGLLSKLQHCSQGLTLATYTTIADACSSREKWKQALQMLKVLSSSQAQADVVSLGPALEASGVGVRWQLALQLLQQACLTNIVISKIARTMAVTAIGQASNRWKWALLLLQAPLGPGVQADTVARNAVVSSLSSGKCWVGATQLLDEVAQGAEAGLLPIGSLPGFAAAIAACTEQERWNQALGLLDGLTSGGLLPDVVSCGLLLMECEQQGLRAREAELLSRLADDLQVFDESAFATADRKACLACPSSVSAFQCAPDHPSPQGLECAVFESPVLTSLARIEKAEILSLAAKSVAERFGGPRRDGEMLDWDTWRRNLLVSCWRLSASYLCRWKKICSSCATVYKDSCHVIVMLGVRCTEAIVDSILDVLDADKVDIAKLQSVDCLEGLINALAASSRPLLHTSRGQWA
ncbi:unnamed protein product, partial [Symbiodinium sp. KB8]